MNDGFVLVQANQDDHKIVSIGDDPPEHTHHLQGRSFTSNYIKGAYAIGAGVLVAYAATTWIKGICHQGLPNEKGLNFWQIGCIAANTSLYPIALGMAGLGIFILQKSFNENKLK